MADNKKLPCKHCGVVGCYREWWEHPLPGEAKVRYRYYHGMVYFVVYTYQNSTVSVLKISQMHSHKTNAIGDYVGYVRPILGDKS